MTAPEHHLPVIRVRLATGYRRLVHIGALATWTTGALWLVYHYFMLRRTEFGFQHHPLEAWWLKLHGAAAFVVLWTWGLLWAAHIKRAWLAGRHRLSGAGLFTAYAVLVLSGYLLYYAGNESLRAALSMLHWSIGLSLPLLLAAHIWHGRLAGALGRILRRPALKVPFAQSRANGATPEKADAPSCAAQD